VSSAPPPIRVPPDTGQRSQLSDLRALLALSMLMTESSSESAVLELLSESVPSLTRCHLEGVYVGEDEWRQTVMPCTGPALRAHLQDQLATLGRLGGPLQIPGKAWAFAYPMRCLTRHAGYALVGADTEPDRDEQFELRVLAQQAGVALTKVWLSEQDRAATHQLSVLNARLEETVAALRHGTEIHGRLTQAAAAGVGVQGITDVVGELTGLAVVVEDRHGTVLARAGDGAKGRGRAGRHREQVLQDALEHGRPLHHDGVWIALARVRDDILGVLTLLDPDGSAGEQQLIALEHGATVLAIELAHVQAMAEAELRRQRDIAEDLLSGADEQSIRMRARALGYELDRPHRVVVAAAAGVDIDKLFSAVRRSAFELQAGSLLVDRAPSVVLLAHTEVDWVRLQELISREVGGADCRLSAGGICNTPADFPRSHREARFALKLGQSSGSSRAVCYDDLGVFRIFGRVADPADLEELVVTWLQALLDYDERRGHDLVETLSAFLECGGNHEQTAERVCIHRSTLKYRLQRIQQISGHDLSDPDTRFHLHLATRAWRTLQTLAD
jgi:sugar diacid utilization regulator